jgi:YD repeat-containing protein
VVTAWVTGTVTNTPDASVFPSPFPFDSPSSAGPNEPFHFDQDRRNTPPLLLAERRGAIVTRVAFHPRSDLLAVGYDDGVVVLTQTGDDRPLLVDEEGAAITALSWNDAGTRLGWGDEDGRIGILDMAARA